MKVKELVTEAIKPLFKGDIKLVDVDYEKRADGMHLVVYIDKDDGVSIDDCVAVDSMVGPVIDELNPTGDESYSLDVSSYGLDKPLKYDWQFKKYYDKLVNIKLYRKVDDRKEFVATLKSKDDKFLIVSEEDFNIALNLKDVASVTPYIEF